MSVCPDGRKCQMNCDLYCQSDFDKQESRAQMQNDIQHQLAEREAELAALVHPFDLEKYRSGK